jgi:hypothetical protein
VYDDGFFADADADCDGALELSNRVTRLKNRVHDLETLLLHINQFCCGCPVFHEHLAGRVSGVLTVSSKKKGV